MEKGMTVDRGFDCTGLLANTISEVWGIDRDNRDIWPNDLRHVRQIVQLANRVDKVDATLTMGSVLVFGKHYDVDGVDLFVPRHVGVFTDVEDSRAYNFIHAKTSEGVVRRDVFLQLPTVGEQEERQFFGVIDPYTLARAALDPAVDFTPDPQNVYIDN